jgi:hypothetical protein
MRSVWPTSSCSLTASIIAVVSGPAVASAVLPLVVLLGEDHPVEPDQTGPGSRGRGDHSGPRSNSNRTMLP